MKLLRPLPFETSLHLSQCLEFRAVAATPSSHNKHKTKSLTSLSKICRRHFCKLVFTWCLLPSNRPALHTGAGATAVHRPARRARPSSTAKIKNRRTARRGASAPAMAPCQIRRSNASVPRLSSALARRPSRRVYARAGERAATWHAVSWRRHHCRITRSGLALPHAPSRTRDRPLCAAIACGRRDRRHNQPDR